MILRPGDLLGLPPGLTDPAQLPALRYLLVALALGWAAAVWRGRPWVGLVAGLVFFETAVGFWVFALGRPYGLLVDPAATRRAAEIAVAAAAGGGEGFLAGTPAPGWWSVRLAAAGFPSSWLLLGPTLLPLLVPALVAVTVHLLARPRDQAALAALLWLAFGSGDLDALGGLGFLGGLWARPGPALAFAGAALAALAIDSRARGRRLWPLAAALVIAASAVGPATPAPGPAAAAWALTMGSWVWLLLGGYGLAQGASGAARALVAGGALVVATASVAPGLGLDAWTGHACYRLGLILAAAGPVARLLAPVGEALARRRPFVGRAGRLGEAVLLAAAVPAAFVTWWQPPALDPVADASRPTVPAPLLDAMAWVRRETAPGAVFMASPSFAPALAALGGRRVLRAPSLAITPDETDRWNL
ncbi:MAG TPA: hypothetical protein VF310_13440, partial [Vicinamibacteria bacterium]